MAARDRETVAIEGGHVVTPERVLPEARLLLREGRVAAIDRASGYALTPDRRVDATGQYVLPGFVDLHGDDVERFRFPRSGAEVDARVALTQCDRHNVAAGVTTKCHAVAFEDLPDDDRTVDLAADVVDAVADAPDLLGDNYVHARCELHDADAVDAVVEAASRDVVRLVSLMTHVPDDGQFAGDGQFAQRYGGAEDAGRRRADVNPWTLRRRADRLLDAATSADVPVASHDDGDPDALETLAANGVDLCEYPLSTAVAERASDLGLTTAMGAPNLVRGESLYGNLCARAAVDANLVDVLCSDYRPYAMLESVFVRTGEPFAKRVRRVTAAPADALGLDDRGRLSVGARADVVLVDPAPVPTVTHAFVAGEEVLRASAPGRDRSEPRDLAAATVTEYHE